MTIDFPVFPVFSFIGFVLSIIPLPWHLQAWNSGTCYYMIWTGLSCLNQFVNSIVWRSTVLNLAPVWCDISIRIMLGSSVAIPAASLCINRRLYHIARVHAVTVTRSEKRRAILIDTMICVFLPMVFIALQYVVQGHRFDIFEGVGCYPFIYNTILAFLLSDCWPIVIGLISACYCCQSLHAFYVRRAQFNQFLAANTSLTASRYFRLMALAMTEVICTVPLASFLMWLNATAYPVAPWVSWKNTHYDFSRVGQYPMVVWTQNSSFFVAVELTRWSTIFCAFVFFAFFGFAAEARKSYRATFWYSMRLLGIRTGSKTSNPRQSRPVLRQLVMLPHGSLPVYVAGNHGVRQPDSPSYTEKSIAESLTSPNSSMLVGSLSYHESHEHGVPCAV